MYVFGIALFACTLCFCGAAYVDTIEKCSYKDDECVKSLYQKALHDIAKTGLPELNIPIIDPLHLTNVTITVLDSLAMTIVDGTVKGVSTCVFHKFHIDLDKLSVSEKVVCDLTLKGQFKLSGSSPTLQGLIGNSDVSGAGKAKVKLDKVTIDLDVPLQVIKKDDGETYINTVFKKVKYTFDVEKASFAAEKIFVGENDISALVVSYLNENWKTLIKTFGKVFVDKAMEYCFYFNDKVFEEIPSKKYIIEDLTSFVKN